MTLTSNPVFRKIERLEATSDRTATMEGIASKTIYFLLLAVLGAIGFAVAHNLFIDKFESIAIPVKNVLHIVTNVPELGVVGIAMIVAAILPLFAWFLRRSIPVTGSLYAICEGIVFGFLTINLANGYQWIPVVTFVITALIIVLMMTLYKTGIVKAGKRFKTIVTTSFIAMIVLSIAFVVMAFIPFTRPVIALLGNPVVSIGFSALGIIFASLFLVVDFDTIQNCIQNKMDKENEWIVAFGLSYSIIYIFGKVFYLVLRSQESK